MPGINPLRLPTSKELQKIIENTAREENRMETERIKNLPEDIMQLRSQIWAQVVLLKEMGQHEEFCDRIIHLFEMQRECVSTDLECRGCGHGTALDENCAVYCWECTAILTDKTQTFEQFWKELPEANEPDTNRSTHARMKAIAQAAFDKFAFKAKGHHE